MCGIAGFLQADPSLTGDAAEQIARAMTDSLEHRGPDDGDVWVDREAGVALGNRRLAIVDLSHDGHQPMTSDRSVLVFNGEIYNHRALRAQLEDAGTRFRGHSDTEVVLAAIDAWGMRTAIDRFNGMFAIAHWDRGDRRLTLVRDRIGEKPLYYGMADGALVFGSELKALRRFPGCPTEVDRDALAMYMRFKYIPAPSSIHPGIRKLLPGHLLQIDGAHRGSMDALQPVPYWSAASVAEAGAAGTPRITDPGDALEELDTLARDAVALRMVADVPLGAFLSGGIDSSAVVALMQAQASQPVRTFTIGFTDAAYDESASAAAVARHLGTDHTELIVTPDDAMAVIPSLPAIYDEPFADSSQVPTYLLAELARKDVVVSLSGDGGDEVFGGYNRYMWGPRVWARAQRVPRSVRRGAAGALTTLSPGMWDSLLSATGQRMAGDKVHKLARALPSSSFDALYVDLLSHWRDPAALVLNTEGRPVPLPPADFLSPGERMMLWDQVGYLPDDILVKLDRATMAVSLEGRVPLLDHRLIEFSWRLSPDLKVREGRGKWLLRQLLAKSVPPALTDRSKMGFGIPIYDWLRGPLRPWAEALLEPSRLRREGYLDPTPVRAAWEAHQSGKRNLQYQLWDVLMFQSWLESVQSA